MFKETRMNMLLNRVICIFIYSQKNLLFSLFYYQFQFFFSFFLIRKRRIQVKIESSKPNLTSQSSVSRSLRIFSRVVNQSAFTFTFYDGLFFAKIAATDFSVHAALLAAGSFVDWLNFHISMHLVTSRNANFVPRDCVPSCRQDTPEKRRY